MNVHFGLESHSNPNDDDDDDDGSDELVIAKYRAQIDKIEDIPKVSISDWDQFDAIDHVQFLNDIELIQSAMMREKAQKLLRDFAGTTPQGERPNSDTTIHPSDTSPMNDITREELDAKLDATNARLEARLSSFESAMRETLAAVRQDSAEMRGELKVMHSELSGLKNIKGSIWGAAGATVIGVGGILAAMLSFGVANYDAGRETSQLVQESKQQTIETRQLLEQIQRQQHSPQVAPAEPSAQTAPK